jgi:hypothetical protein
MSYLSNQFVVPMFLLETDQLKHWLVLGGTSCEIVYILTIIYPGLNKHPGSSVMAASMFR